MRGEEALFVGYRVGGPTSRQRHREQLGRSETSGPVLSATSLGSDDPGASPLAEKVVPDPLDGVGGRANKQGFYDPPKSIPACIFLFRGECCSDDTWLMICSFIISGAGRFRGTASHEKLLEENARRFAEK